MGIQRYLLKFGYSGSGFIGVQRQLKRARLHERLLTPGFSYKDSKSVQGALELILYDLKPLNDPIFSLSSRTDRGVHAVSNSGSVDLVHPDEGEYFDPKEITYMLNSSLESLGFNIRIYKTLAVPGSFNPRWAKKRTYIYKLAIPKSNFPGVIPSIEDPQKYRDSKFHVLRQFEYELLAKKYPHLGILPLDLRDSITELKHSLNLDTFRDALNLFEGKHNFASFCHVNYLKNLWETYHGGPFDVNVMIPSCERELQISLTPSLSLSNHPTSEYFDFYEIKITSTSFLYNQIRRMIGSAIESCRSNSLERIKILLENPHPSSWSGIHLADPVGLHLYDIEYSSDILRHATDVHSCLPVGPEPSLEEIPSFSWIPWEKISNFKTSNESYQISKKEFYQSSS